MRRLAAMSVRTSQCDCAVHPSPGISEILPPALTASLKVRSMCLAGSPCLAIDVSLCLSSGLYTCLSCCDGRAAVHLIPLIPGFAFVCYMKPGKFC